jgi:GntR family transcriptional repressor for pyruvate dehydrogenase complex
MVARATDLSPLMPFDNAGGVGQPVRSPKAAELVAQTLRRMIVSGELKDGDFLPNETELMAHFGVSRPTLREGIRVLESDRLVEVRRGSRTGARVRVPGPEIVARPAGLLLEVSGATIGDVRIARSGIEPLAARLLAEKGSTAAFDELEALVEQDIPQGFRDGHLAAATANFHRRVVELSGNATLSLMAGMLNEITERHTAAAIRKRRVPEAQYQKLVRSYRHLIELLRAGNGDEAEAHWRRQLDTADKLLLNGQESIKVRDVMV